MSLLHPFRKQPQGEHLPEFIPASCLGDKCPNYQGTPCDTTESEWLSAGGSTKGRDREKPPLKDEATYIIYGQRCLEGAHPELVAQRIELYKPAEVDGMMLIAQSGRYGDMPVEIVNGDNPTEVLRVETIASSDN